MLSDETSGKPIDEPSRFAGGRRPTARSRPWWLGLAAAATLVLAVSFLAIQQFQNVGPDEPVYRTPSGGGLASEIDPSTPMPRDDLILRWRGAPDGTTYDIRVTTDRLAPLHRTFGIERTEHSVPEDALADLPPGAVILWNVTAHLPDGRRWTSNSFRATGCPATFSEAVTVRASSAAGTEISTVWLPSFNRTGIGLESPTSRIASAGFVYGYSMVTRIGCCCSIEGALRRAVRPGTC